MTMTRTMTMTKTIPLQEKTNSESPNPPATLARILEINRRLIQPEERMSLQIADRLWCEEGKPCTVPELSRCVERALRLCVSEGILYAPVLLLRKKSLDRGTWRPALPQRHATQHFSATQRCSATSPAATQKPAASMKENSGSGSPGESCARCGNTGLYTSPDGMTGYLCPCGAYMRNLKASRAAARA